MEEADKETPWRKPSGTHKIKKLQSQKRALQDRLFDYDSPTKRSKQTVSTRGRKSLHTSFQSPPHPDTNSACDDSTLMDLLGIRPIIGEMSTSQVLSFSQLLTSPSKPIPVHTSPAKVIQPISSVSPQVRLISGSDSGYSLSPLKAFVQSDTFSSPSKDSRRTLVPRRLPISPSFTFKSRVVNRKPLNDLLPPAQGGPSWHQYLCLDWSLKSELGIISPHNYGWSCNNLKTSEESSGISAFVRCIDIEPPEKSNPSCPSTGSSQLDTSLGAQFHQCCLYWQHPSLPAVSFFPRGPGLILPKPSFGKVSNVGTSKTPGPILKFDKSVTDAMYLEWVEAIRSAFQLLKARQCPFFYICTNTFTCLFCSAGTQGDEQTQIYVSPTTRELMETLKTQNINFTLPYANTQSSGKDDEVDKVSDDSEVDDDLDKSPVKATLPVSSQPPPPPHIMLISGSDSLLFFNFIINAKSLLITSFGQFAGLPPTILSPVAFHGATLKTLQVSQRNVAMDKLTLHYIELKGPILPHVLHMLTSLLNKTVKSYKIRLKTIESTIPLNLYANMNQVQGRVKPSAFDLQNLSDCGLNKSILDVFCRCDNCDTITEMLEGKRGMYRWQ